MTIEVLILTGVNILLVMVNVGLLSIFTKMYSEILKMDHIKRIGKDLS